MKIIGLTGRSGCGKSTVAQAFRAAGIPCGDADAVSRRIYDPGSPLLEKIAERFGADLILEDGTLNRRALANRAFADPQGTADLTAMTHPEIFRRLQLQIDAAREEGNGCFLLDAPVLIGSDFEKKCDIIVVVTAPYDSSVERICRRDGIDVQAAQRRLAAQLPEQVLTEHADYVLCNDGSLDQLRQKARRLVEELKGE